MNELNNVSTASGNYNNIPTSLTSNLSVVNIVEGLSLKKEADKKNWSDGNLTYTITIENNTETSYENPTVTDIIDTGLVSFVTGSVKINNVLATEGQYNYDTDSHKLTVTPGTVSENSTTTITFSVKKKT